ncbi:MAG: hypothetical protein ABI461_07240, partial [Polyangiaceae bacterium]
EITSTHAFGEVVLHDYENFLQRTAQTETALKVHAAMALLDAASGDSEIPSQVGQLLGGIEALLHLPGKVTETLTFTFFGKNGDHEVATACRAIDSAKFFGFTDPPEFTMTCRIVSKVDGVGRDFIVVSHGSVANTYFNGWLTSPNAERAIFASQNVVILGAGGVLGFDLHLLPAKNQIAAISFFQTPGENDQSLPAAWEAPQASPGWQDAVMATLALTYAFPWPSGCDAQDIRNQGAAHESK